MSVLVVASATPEGRAALAEGAAEARRRGTALLWLDVGAEPAGDVAPLLDGTPARHVARDPNQDPTDAVLDAVAAEDVEVLVVGTRRRSPLGKFVLGSMAQKLILDAPVPVLTVKVPAGADGRTGS
ncbi:universal stress protein [Promicromonospora sp. MS192]|uniref:universal stress protein n=1 Tax=Promicromonospora sp. MS192 TaxID=3412684 RepID=UPI003C2B76E9